MEEYDDVETHRLRNIELKATNLLEAGESFSDRINTMSPMEWIDWGDGGALAEHGAFLIALNELNKVLNQS